jgi:hypothetical protein
MLQGLHVSLQRSQLIVKLLKQGRRFQGRSLWIHGGISVKEGRGGRIHVERSCGLGDVSHALSCWDRELWLLSHQGLHGIETLLHVIDV